MLPPVPLFPVPDDEAVVETLALARAYRVAPLTVVIVGRNRKEDGWGHDGQNGERTNHFQRHFELPGRKGKDCF